jgi:hypothetical protein
MIVFENRHVNALSQVSKTGISNVAAHARSSAGSPFDPVDISSRLRNATNQPNTVSRLVFIESVFIRDRSIGQPSLCARSMYDMKLSLY